MKLKALRQSSKYNITCPVLTSASHQASTCITQKFLSGLLYHTPFTVSVFDFFHVLCFFSSFLHSFLLQFLSERRWGCPRLIIWAIIFYFFFTCFVVLTLFFPYRSQPGPCARNFCSKLLPPFVFIAVRWDWSHYGCGISRRVFEEGLR